MQTVRGVDAYAESASRHRKVYPSSAVTDEQRPHVHVGRSQIGQADDPHRLGRTANAEGKVAKSRLHLDVRVGTGLRGTLPASWKSPPPTAGCDSDSR